jgi:phage tail sheath protein FI
MVGVVAGVGAGTYRIQIADADSNILEQSYDLATQQAAVDWSKGSQYVTIALGASTNNPTVANLAALSAGNDDLANVTDSQWVAALDNFTADLGPGQVSAPGRTSDTVHVALLDHADSHTRVALLDLIDTANTATLTTAVVNGRVGNEQWGGAFAPWIIVPGITPGTTRTIPPSALVAGLVARNDPSLGPNQPSAGSFGVSRFALDLSQNPWSDDDRSNLNTASVNVIIDRLGDIMVYGWRSMVDEISNPAWVDFANSRLYVAIAAEADAVGELYVFQQLDGQGQVIASFNGALTGMLLGFYTEGALYGATSNDAFSVDTGSQVNTPDTLANNELHAVLNVRMSPFAEMVAIEVVKTPITQAVT